MMIIFDKEDIKPSYKIITKIPKEINIDIFFAFHLIRVLRISRKNIF
jgi:hypothetical protein